MPPPKGGGGGKGHQMCAYFPFGSSTSPSKGIGFGQNGSLLVTNFKFRFLFFKYKLQT